MWRCTSCFGSVKSLNSAPEVGIVVTAVAEGAPMEETVRVTRRCKRKRGCRMPVRCGLAHTASPAWGLQTTDDEGNYRLRGLKPGATYVVSVHDRYATCRRGSCGALPCSQSCGLSGGLTFDARAGAQRHRGKLPGA